MWHTNRGGSSLKGNKCYFDPADSIEGQYCTMKKCTGGVMDGEWACARDCS